MHLWDFFLRSALLKFIENFFYLVKSFDFRRCAVWEHDVAEVTLRALDVLGSGHQVVPGHRRQVVTFLQVPAMLEIIASYLLSWFGIFKVQVYRIPPTPGCNVPPSSCYIRNSCKLLFNLFWRVSSKSYLKYYQSKFIGFQSLNWNSTLKCYYLLGFKENQLHFKCSSRAIVVGYHFHCIVL